MGTVRGQRCPEPCVGSHWSRKKDASPPCLTQSKLRSSIHLLHLHVSHARHLTLIATTAVFIGCASLAPTPRKPSPADSILAATRLDEVLVEHTRRIVSRNERLRLALGLRLDRLPTHYVDERREESRTARSTQRELEGIWYEALRQDDYLTLIALHWELENEAEAAVYRAMDFSAFIPGAAPLPAIARALAQHPMEETPDVERYLFLLDNVSQYFQEAVQALADRFAYVPVIALAGAQIDFQLELIPGGHPVMGGFGVKVERLAQLDQLKIAQP